jgi:hypothetical protein
MLIFARSNDDKMSDEETGDDEIGGNEMSHNDKGKHDKIERQMEFIVEHQAKFDVDLAQLTSEVKSLASTVESLTFDVRELTGVVASMQEEMRDGFNNLIVANEVTRDLASQVAKLAISNPNVSPGLRA